MVGVSSNPFPPFNRSAFEESRHGFAQRAHNPKVEGPNPSTATKTSR